MTNSKEYKWFLTANLEEYRGKHIAILDREIIASGDSAREVWEKARLNHSNREFLMAKVPEEEILIL